MILETKKGDEIQKRQDIEAGKSLMHGFSTMDKAKAALLTIYQHYNLPQSAVLGCGVDDHNPNCFAVIAQEDTYVVVNALVNWVVDHEVGIQYMDSGGSEILDMREEEGWVVIKSATPTYQSGVEHMSDEELRASIEELRTNRVARPVAVRKVGAPKAPPISAEDKALNKVLGGMTAEAKLDLQRKLGLIE